MHRLRLRLKAEVELNLNLNLSEKKSGPAGCSKRSQRACKG
jgi:hypothetical protein